MKIIIPSICALAVLSGCCENEYGTSGNYPYHHRFAWGGRCGVEQNDVTNQSAWLRHRAALNVDRQTAAWAAAGYTGNATSQLTPSGTTIFGATPGAASIQASTITEKAPPSGTLIHSPAYPPGQYSSTGPVEAVGERTSVKMLHPSASPVPGRPGYVISPFSPKSGYIDVSGLSPGSDAKDPYTGKVFRVP